ncbi:4Fe-4S binding protein [bacterium]|nr:4Fe-4S binding protein [bacterium]
MSKVKRNIVKIDEEKCNGCGLCIPNCKEGALQIVNGKAKLVSDIYCDGLGACLGHCPQDAIKIEERETSQFDEEAVKEHLKESKSKAPKTLACGCPGTMTKTLKKESINANVLEQPSELNNWPIQLRLVSPDAPYLKNADVVLLADCTAVAYSNLHRDFIKNRVVLMGCPKLDDLEYYRNKLKEMVDINNFRSLEVVMMEVPCCTGLGAIAEDAVNDSNSRLFKTIITLEGKKQL